MTKRMRSNVLLVLTAIIWGLAFVAQDVGMDYVGPFTFNAVRNILGGLFLIPVMYVLRKENNVQAVEDTAGSVHKYTILGGIFCGLALFVGSSVQQFGIMHTSVGKAGFITALYIIIVPILGIFLKKKVGLKVWTSVVIAVIGMYLLCVTEGVSVNKGDLLIVISSVAFSVHILVIDYFSPRAECVRMSCIQFLVCGVLSVVGMFLVEQPELTQMIAAWKPLIYAGVMSSAIGYTLQIFAQKETNPVVASLILSLESVFACIFGWVILGQVLSPKELMGCALVFVAIIVAQLPEKKSREQRTSEQVVDNI